MNTIRAVDPRPNGSSQKGWLSADPLEAASEVATPSKSTAGGPVPSSSASATGSPSEATQMSPYGSSSVDVNARCVGFSQDDQAGSRPSGP